ncbi:deubiquitination module subunit SGF73 Ecym_2198 [Eremothecium cymbalariae DBVPG|uniref:SCA7 domain-containing protein n=1 Tax=Eremothecium cymbalariae (strain CBS 270.75 / DBVPG 7215 / KCTC 17166 / NRRL Y-17582) TaxID=931890 RepID=G8JP42_ERECY|nr:Hypothetical protein Ecym_2198 [Eremothecium cymbalariae DBVPG\
MIDIHSNIRRLKTTIQLTALDTTTNNGWKDLIPIVKDSTNGNAISGDTSDTSITANNSYTAQDLKSLYLSNTVPVINLPIEYRTCNDCGRPIAYSALIDHLQNHCRGRVSSNTVSSISSTREMSPAKVKALKRTNSIDSDLSPSKKQRKSSTPATKKQRKVKQRNPTEPHLVDLDKQCGVELPENGVCGRSLTCKSHSMGAKRAVQGRTKSFDVLLAEYQKKNHIKSATKGNRSKVQPNNQQQQQLQKQKQQEKELEESVPVLSPEEETTQVLNGVSRSFPLPLETNVLTSTQTRTKYFRMREMFASSFSVRPGYSAPGYGAIHSRVGCIDLDRTTDYTFRIRVPQLISQSSLQNSTPQQLQAIQQHLLKQQQQQPQQIQQLPPGQPQQQLHQQTPSQPQLLPQQSQQLELLAQGSKPLTGQGKTAPYQQPKKTNLANGIENQKQLPTDRPMTPSDVQTQQLLMQQQQQHANHSLQPSKQQSQPQPPHSTPQQQSQPLSQIQTEQKSPQKQQSKSQTQTQQQQPKQEQQQRQKLQQRRKLEDASAQLNTASRLIQGTPLPVNGNSVVNSSGIGSPVNVTSQGRVNVGWNGGYDSRFD